MTSAAFGVATFAMPRRSFALASALFVLAFGARARAADAPASPTDEQQAAHPVPPVPMTAEARAHYEQGLRLYGDHDFPAAIREFEAGFAVEPRREFLFGEAQAYRLAGDCARAVPLYERFLGSGPSALQVDATRLALDRCARQPPPKAETPTATKVAPPLAPSLSPSGPTAAPPAIAARAPWWHDRWALGAMGAGLAATGVGLGFVIASHSAADQANGPGTTHYADYQRLWDTAERRQTIGVAALAVGGALLATGALRLVWVRRHATPENNDAGAAERDAEALHVSTAVVAPTAGGAALLGQVTF
jgi:hypothetical protein